MRAGLVLMMGMFFWLMIPAVGEAHQAKQQDHKRSGYSQHQNGHRGHEDSYRQHDRHQHKAWKKHRRAEKRWNRYARHQPSIKVVYRDRYAYPLFSRIVINLPF